MNWARFKGVGYIPPVRPWSTLIDTAWLVFAMRWAR